VTNDRSTNRPIVSMTASAGTPNADITRSAAANEAPPEKQDRAQSPRWSSGNNSS
jgi:hypothetical protein